MQRDNRFRVSLESSTVVFGYSRSSTSRSRIPKSRIEASQRVSQARIVLQSLTKFSLVAQLLPLTCLSLQLMVCDGLTGIWRLRRRDMVLLDFEILLLYGVEEEAWNVHG